MDGLDLSRPLTARAGALTVERQFFCKRCVKMGPPGRAEEFLFRCDCKGRRDLMTLWAAVHRKTGKKKDAGCLTVPFPSQRCCPCQEHRDAGAGPGQPARKGLHPRLPWGKSSYAVLYTPKGNQGSALTLLPKGRSRQGRIFPNLTPP